MLVRKWSVILLLLSLAAVAIALVSPHVLPERYFYDSQTIRTLIEDRYAEHSPSFHATARIYAWLGFGSLLPHWLVGAFGVTVALASIAAGSRVRLSPWRPTIALLVAAWTVPIAVYHGQYTKETFAIVVVAAMLLVSTRPAGIVVAATLALVYAALFRNYWIVVVALWLVLVVAWRAGYGWTARIVSLAVALVPLSLASHAAVGLWLSDGRTITVEERLGEADSATVFFNLLENSSPVTDIINTAAGTAMLAFPFYLLSVGALQHIAFALFQLVNTAMFIRIARAAKPPVRGRKPTAFEWRQAAAIAFCVAYTIVLGMLEPDFGSFVKHETNILPMLVFLFAWSEHDTSRSRVPVSRLVRHENPRAH